MKLASRSGLVASAVWLFVILLPFQWIALAEVAGRSLKPVHLALVVLAVGFLALRRPVASITAMLRATDSFALLFLLYLTCMMLAILWTRTPIGGAVLVIKNGINFAAFLTLGAIIAGQPSSNVLRAADKASYGGLTVFLVAAIAVFALVGRNLVFEVVSAILRGDAKWLQFGVYPVLFKLAGGKPPGESAESFSTNLRNTLVGAFFMYLVLINVARPTRLAITRSRAAIATFFSLMACGLIVISVSRSNLLVLAISLATVAGLKVALGWRPTLARAAAGALGLTLVTGALIPGLEAAAGVVAIVEERFTGLEDNARVELLQSAVPEIERHPIRGLGLATKVEFDGDKAGRMHNLFAVSWLELGLVGLAVSILFYSAIALAALRHVLMVLKRREDWVLPLAPEWVAVLPVLPLLRAQVSGGGAFTMIEWSCLAFFFGLIARNRRELTGDARPLSVPTSNDGRSMVFA